MVGVRRTLVDLAKDRNGVAGIGTKHEGGLILDGRLEREFGARKYADSHRTILWRGESSRAGVEQVFRPLWLGVFARCRTYQGTPVLEPPDGAILTEEAPRRIKRIAERVSRP